MKTHGWIGLSASAMLLSLLTVSDSRAQANELQPFVAAEAGALEVLHRKAERSLVGVAQDPSYRDYFKVTSSAERQRLKERIDRISLETQKKFAVSEMCLINAKGHEISRIVEGEIADDLSTEEAQNIFFQPSFAQAPRTAYVSPIYISPDTHRWVIGYATPIEVEAEKKAVLHYEHDLSAFQDLLRPGSPTDDGRFLLAVTAEGWIIADSRREIPTEQRDEKVAPGDYFEAFAAEGTSLEDLKQEASGHGIVTLDGEPHEVAWQRVKGWILLGFEKAG